MRHAVILAGGSGTRLWPASRRARPKQLLALTAENVPMVVAAAALGESVSSADMPVMVVTADSLVDATRTAASTLEIVAEPVARNTAAAIGLAAAILADRDPDATMVVLPADQHITDRVAFADVLRTGLSAVEADPDLIATIGITPTRAETGFGYLEIAGAAVHGRVTDVKRFVEKPDRVAAEAYVESGRFLWNAGIFCARAQHILEELDTHLPVTGAAVRLIAKDRARARALYPTLPSISFDHAIMEKTDRVVCVPASVGWDDVGSWAALPAVRGTDDHGNTIIGQAIVIDGENNVVLTDEHTLIATVGLSDIVVVKSGDAILVIRKDEAQDVRKVIDALSARGLARYL